MWISSARLLLNRGDDFGMAMAGRGHGDAGGKIEELVAIHIFDHNAASALGNQRIRARVGRRNIFFIACENALGIGAGKRRLELGAGMFKVLVVMESSRVVLSSRFSVLSVIRPDLRAASIATLGWDSARR